MNEINKIRIIFTPKASSAVDEILSSFKFNESPEEFEKKHKAKKVTNIITVKSVARNLAMQTITEKEASISLQKDAGVSGQVAEQIVKQILTTVVPFFEKVNENDLEDSTFVNNLGKKIWGGEEVQTNNPNQQQTIKPPTPIGVTEALNKNIEKPTELIKKIERIKKTDTVKEPIKPASPKPQPRKAPGSDSYLEPIE